jgi:hypothetical protein
VSDLALGLQLDGELNAVALQEAVDEIVERHEILRTGFYGLRNSAIGERYMVLLQNALKNRNSGAGVPLVDLWGSVFFKAASSCGAGQVIWNWRCSSVQTCSERLTSEQCSMIFNEPWLR